MKISQSDVETYCWSSEEPSETSAAIKLVHQDGLEAQCDDHPSQTRNRVEAARRMGAELAARAGLPEPEFALWQEVEVTDRGGKNTRRQGVVRQIVWHFKDERYYFWIRTDDRDVSKRYSRADLRVPESGI